MTTSQKKRPTIDQRIQRARDEGYLAGREELNGTVKRLEADLSDQKRLLQDAMAALIKEREANEEAHEPIDLWPSKPMAVRGGFYHQWPEQDVHLWSKWQQETGFPNPTLYRTCIHPECREVQSKPAPRG